MYIETTSGYIPQLVGTLILLHREVTTWLARCCIIECVECVSVVDTYPSSSFAMYVGICFPMLPITAACDQT